MCRDFPGTTIDSHGALHHCQPHVQWQCFFQARGRRTSFCGHVGGPLVLTPCFKVSQTVSFFCRSMVEPWTVGELMIHDWNGSDAARHGAMVVAGCAYSLNWLWFIELYTYTHTRIHSCSWVDLHDIIHSVFDLWNFAWIAAHKWADHEIAVRSNRCSILDDEFSLGQSGQVLLVFHGESEKDMVQNCWPPKFVEVSDPKDHPQTVPSLWQFFRRQEWLPTGTVTCGRVSAPISPTSRQAPVVQFSVRVYGVGLSCLMVL